MFNFNSCLIPVFNYIYLNYISNNNRKIINRNIINNNLKLKILKLNVILHIIYYRFVNMNKLTMQM